MTTARAGRIKVAGLGAWIVALGGATGPAAAQQAPESILRELDWTSYEVVYTVPEMAQARVLEDLPFKEASGAPLTADLYLPPAAQGEGPFPLVVFVNGVGLRGLKEWGGYRSWPRLVAASGLAAVTYQTSDRASAAADLAGLIDFLRKGAGQTGIDPERVALWACSSNVEAALPFAMDGDKPWLRAAVLYYGDGEAASFRPDLPVLFVRSGRNTPRLNQSMADLAARAIDANAPWSTVNLPASPHAFDLFTDTPEARTAIRLTLEFLRSNLASEPYRPAPASLARQAVIHHAAHEDAEAEVDLIALAEQYPSTGRLWARLGGLQLTLSKDAEAVASLTKAVALGGSDGSTYYNLACAYALTGEKAKAIAALEQALGAGFSNRKQMATDSDLASLHDEPRFRELAGLGAATGDRTTPEPGTAATESSQGELRSGTIQVSGGELFYEMQGQGEMLVLIHDGLLHRETWNEQLAPFAEHFTVVRYDRRGYGRSSKPTAPYSNVDDLLALFDRLHIGKACLAGMSAGGGLAADFTLAHPDRVSALVLVGAVVSGFGYTDHFTTRGGHFTPADAAKPAAMLRYFARDPYIVAAQNTAAKARVRRLLKANTSQNLNPDIGRLSRPPARPAVTALAEITVPTLIVVGDQDIPDVHAHAGAFAAGIKGAQRIIISGAGHLVPLEQPATFNEAALRFLRGRDIVAALAADRIDEAARLFAAMRAKTPGLVPFTERSLNATGYRLLQQGKVDEAIAVFRLNVEAYPASANVYDSLGEGYAVKGDVAQAIAAYERSLALNPDNVGGKAALDRLRASFAQRAPAEKLR